MKLSVIIPTKDRQEILQRTLHHLAEATEGVDAEIIVVNDSEKKIELQHADARIKIVQNSKSGAASARNTGVKNSEGGLLLFLDDDILVNKANIARTFALHEKGAKRGYNFFWLYPPDLIEKLPQSSLGRYILKHLLFTNSHRIKINDQHDELIHANGLTSQYFSILRSDFLLTGGYDENIPHAGIEDMILYKELTKQGIEIFISPSDIVFQNESDRLELNSILERCRRGAITIRKANELGYEMKYVFPVWKKMLGATLLPFKGMIYQMAKSLPGWMICDMVRFRLINLLLGLSFYKGYFRDSE